MLTADRQQMTDRAVRCFEAQHYANKSLLILDTGGVRYRLPPGPHAGVSIIYAIRSERETLGDLRNHVASLIPADSVIVHWDSDDWSYYGRIREQVAALVCNPTAECVGYHDAMFYDTWKKQAYHWQSNLQPNAILGGSAMYWRTAWERVQFPKLNYAEDSEWLKEVRTVAITKPYPSPRMIITQHGGNTRALDFGYLCEHSPDAWRRAKEWDEYCERTIGE